MADFKRSSRDGRERSFNRGSGDRNRSFSRDRRDENDEGSEKPRSFSNDRRDRDSGRSFNRDRRGGRSFSRDRRRDGPKEMFKVVCDECGEKCEVPFKPTAGKPVLCSSCFEKKNVKNAVTKDKNYQKEFDTLNAKLDLMMKEILELKKDCSKKEASEEKKPSVKKTVKKAKPKKEAKKKK
jgi:CxxC-x17-CxxC domain-containing protein